jgi:hypothetical protein
MKFTVKSITTDEDGGEQEVAKKTYFGFREFRPANGLTKPTNLIAVVQNEDSCDVWELDDEESLADLALYY